MIGRGRIGASERRHSREAVFEGRLAIDQMESLANQLGAPTTARKRLQADLLPRLSGYSAERQRERLHECGACRRHNDLRAGRRGLELAWPNYHTRNYVAAVTTIMTHLRRDMEIINK